MHILFLYIFLFAVILMGALFALQRPLFSRLSMRIAVLILASGPVAVLILLILQAGMKNMPVPPWLRLLQVFLILIGGPVVLGLLAARFVRRPLAQFKQALTALEQSNYTVQLRSTGIREFDEVFFLFNEVTKRLQHEEKLRKDLVSDASHELNTPLTAMIGQLTAIEEDKLPMTKERAVKLREEAERLAGLVQQLDEYTKARMSDASQRERVLLKECCEGVVRRFALELDETSIRVKIGVAEDLTVLADRTALQQILINLIQNTLRYAKASEIAISATNRELVFADNGKGVPSGSLPFLFERFYRLDKSRSRETGGLGLGLAIVRELAEGQGWSIGAANTSPGLSFTISFAKHK